MPYRDVQSRVSAERSSQQASVLPFRARCNQLPGAGSKRCAKSNRSLVALRFVVVADFTWEHAASQTTPNRSDNCHRSVSATTFLSNETLWQILPATVKAARRGDAAVAYFGRGGARLLPLRRGDRLIVDMSLPTVRAGATDPREVATLIRRGVQAFSRRNLHAKIVVTEKLLIAGSANVSRNSQRVLDEAAIMTTERSAIRRAREFIDRLCTEPVRPEYLMKCKQFYKPPRFDRKRSRGVPGQRRATHTKLWVVNLQEVLASSARNEAI